MKDFSKPVKEKRRVKQLAIGQIGIGDVTAPILFALTDNGEMWLRPYKVNPLEKPEWAQIEDLPEKDLYPVPEP